MYNFKEAGPDCRWHKDRNWPLQVGYFYILRAIHAGGFVAVQFSRFGVSYRACLSLSYFHGMLFCSMSFECVELLPSAISMPRYYNVVPYWRHALLTSCYIDAVLCCLALLCRVFRCLVLLCRVSGVCCRCRSPNHSNVVRPATGHL